ncbi:MoaD/ThiS family protein [Zhihengliuella flava]|uniref:Molybdopterin synthase sulfur carrier subunit n=1 Tax=Zhihengliuella flava TaxID=1285193 RepID=A0A931GKS7_9MICC|nr:MoaD/ThiS family protein [Zhihengliuella flava]MBG6083794.1 molybdopterin converting factor small subunit [Zhihengliuella flava]
MLIRYFAAASAAAGCAEEKFDDVAPPVTLGELLDAAVARHPAEAGSAVPSLERVISRSTFLINEVSVRDRSRALAAGDVVDILPPFAGG